MKVAYILRKRGQISFFFSLYFYRKQNNLPLILTVYQICCNILPREQEGNVYQISCLRNYTGDQKRA